MWPYYQKLYEHQFNVYKVEIICANTTEGFWFNNEASHTQIHPRGILLSNASSSLTSLSPQKETGQMDVLC